ncbi:hypothetical protein GH714_020535 [Hevea brasiliensis]|uniref:AB hydrolase-1 domain-containing protein n=1 Tax=Hevea brasiliensis TaxID=3981 RepID=A0A6A6KTA3_HEVBR|nr:hypothetical protein GH714_020535 [Hevea brasiliensis]
MLVNYAPPSLKKPLLLASSSLFSPHTTSRQSPLSFSKLLHFHCRRSSFHTFAAMAEAKDAAFYSPPEHDVGSWYSVPDLRLRDHRFTVPLDYSVQRSASPNLHFCSRIVAARNRLINSFDIIIYVTTGFCTEVAEYLKYFRADNIVNDAEFIRVCLVPDAGPWTILGQSYGGFCAVTYLSFAPQGLKQALITGGIPPVRSGCTADIVYRACYEQVIRQNEKYYKRFPQDAEIVREVVIHLAESEGGGGDSSNWSAYRILAEDNGKFDAIRAAKEGRPVFFTGEMVFPWMFDEIHALKQFKDAAELLAEKKDWPPLYDIAVLKNNKVPVAAAVYYEDLYVNFKLAMETASLIADPECGDRFRWRQQYRRRYPDEFLDKADSRGKGDYQIDYEPAPRITEADKTNDRKSLQRALDRRLYLLLYGKAYGSPSGKAVWHFPEKIYEAEETLRKCAESALQSVLGNLSHTYFVGNAPMGHMIIQPTDNAPDAGYKDELLEYFPEQAEFLNKMIITELEVLFDVQSQRIFFGTICMLYESVLRSILAIQSAE